MLEFKPIELKDRKLLNKYLSPYNFKTCEYTFISLYIWRKALDIKFTILDNCLIIKKLDFDGASHFMQPIGYKNNLSEILEELENYKNQNNLDYLFKDAEQPFIDDLNISYKDKYEIEKDRDNFDYIYESNKLINLSGKKLHKKKNHYNNFIKTYNFRWEPLSKDIVKECITTARIWCREKNCKGFLREELYAIEDMLINMKDLNFVGIVVYIDDTLSAFTIGEKVNENMAIIHIEKANPNIRGLYAFINKTFVENYFLDTLYINREQDLGLEGLRTSKLSYTPYKLEPKYKVK
ncbi:MAG: DUF2156 domain-containing protein [Clostridiaceae bacterium]